MNAPVHFDPGAIWSLWDMFELDGGRLTRAVGFVNVTHQLLIVFEKREKLLTPERPHPVMSARGLESLSEHAEELVQVGNQADLPMVARAASDLLQELKTLPEANSEGLVPLVGDNFFTLQGMVGKLQIALGEEARNKPFLVLTARDARLWAPSEPLFGKTVEAAFPSAIEDIEEAAKCLAVSRGTACVMHLMRATEVPLKALAANLGVGTQNDWGSYIREIDKELGARLKAAGKRTPDESFYAEASEAFERVKRAWRNRTMHIDQAAHSSDDGQSFHVIVGSVSTRWWAVLRLTDGVIGQGFRGVSSVGLSPAGQDRSLRCNGQFW